MTANCAPTYDAIAHRCSHIRNSPPLILVCHPDYGSNAPGGRIWDSFAPREAGSGSSIARCARSNHRVEIERARARESRIPVPAFLDDSLLRLEVAVHDPETLLEALGPFEVVGERPQKIAAHVGAGFHRAPDLGDKAPQEADAPSVVHLAVSPRAVAV